MNKTAILIIIGLMALSSRKVPVKNPLTKAAWLIGTWENQTPKGTVYESWTKVSDNEFQGKSYALKENDTLVFETIRLVRKKKQLFYIPTVKNQNNGLPVSFAMTSISDTSLIFENRQHDFPQQISYILSGNDALTAQISGTVNGQEQTRLFPMKKLR